MYLYRLFDKKKKFIGAYNVAHFFSKADCFDLG